jgi:hypothetical protein
MNAFMRHTSADADAPWEEFNTTQELLALEWVQKWGKGSDFSHFAMSDRNLMEVSNGGYNWWVIGFIRDPSAVDLPKWEPKYREPRFVPGVRWGIR